ncbi:MAG TPA: hypothetical protein VFK70_06365, partial [Vicinamibacteria bacterium]|nr:hypothetical protein [Vicinamibacteria bacterium]
MRSLLAALALAAATLGCARTKAAVESSADPGATGAPAAGGSAPPDTTPPAPPSSTLPPLPPPPPEPQPGRQPVAVEMRNVDLHITDDITLRIAHLDGRFVGTSRSGVPYLDDPSSYEVVVDSARIVLDMASLNALLNEHVLGHGRSNVEDLHVATDDKGRLVQKGEIDKGLDIPFKVKGAVEATSDGRIRVHAKSVRGFGLPVKPLMKLFSVEMDDLLKVEPGHGVWVDDNDLILDPQLMLPPPHIRGKVTEVHVEGDTLVQTLGTGGPHALRPAAVSPNHIYWRGGALKFGKLTMANTDLELVDMDPKDPFDFSARR